MKHSVTEVKDKLADIIAIDLDIPEMLAKIQRASSKLASLTEAAILLSTLGLCVTVAGQSLKQRVCEMNFAEKQKLYGGKADYLTMNCLVGTNTTWAEATAKLDACVLYSPLSYDQLCTVPMLFQEQAKNGVCFMPARSLMTHFSLSEVLRAALAETFPLLLLEKNKKQVLVDNHEMLVNEELFEEILTLDDSPACVTSEVDAHSESDLETTIDDFPE